MKRRIEEQNDVSNKERKILGDQCSNSEILRKVIKDRNGNEDQGFSAIKQIIEKKIRANEKDETEEEIARMGIYILLRTIKRKLRAINTNINSKKIMIQKRLHWFSSKECNNILLKKILKDDFNNYTDFFKQFFKLDEFHNNTLDTYNIKFRGPESGMETVNANDQCKIVIGAKPTDINSKCYICNHTFYNHFNHDFFQLDCEHILPLESAISHISILQDKRSEYEKYLEKEYSWAHKCCNIQKGNIDVVKYTLGGWEVDRKAVKKILKNIQNSNSTGCRTIQDHGPVFTKNNVNRITSKVQPLVDIINRNVNLIGGGYYRLYLFYKLISSFKNEFLDSILKGKNPHSGGGETDSDEFEDIFNPNNIEFNEILLQEINDVTDEIIENPEHLKPLYVKRQHILYNDDNTETIINRFYPYDIFQKFSFESKKNGTTMPDFKPVKTYYTDDNIISEFPAEGNPYGIFDDSDIDIMQNKTKGGTRKKKSNKKKKSKHQYSNSCNNNKTNKNLKRHKMHNTRRKKIYKHKN